MLIIYCCAVIIIIIVIACPFVLNLIDIDECSTGVHNCTQNQQCVNRNGGYQCKCVSGYELLDGNCEGKYCIV